MTPRDVIWVGIDVGKAHHHATAVDRDGEMLWSMRVANDQAAVEKLIRRAGAATPRHRGAGRAGGAGGGVVAAGVAPSGPDG